MSEKLNIVILTNQFFEESHTSGISIYNYKLAQTLRKLGHNPVVVVCSKKDETTTYDGLQVYKVNTNKKYFWEKILKKLFKNYFDESIRLLVRSFLLRRCIEQIWRDVDISLVHCANTGGVSFFRIKAIPTVVRISMHTGFCIKEGFSTPKSKSAMRQRIIIENLAMKRADAIFGPGKMVAAMVEKDINRPVEVIETPYYSDVQELDDSVYSSTLRGQEYLLYFGLIDIHKGIDTIADIIFPLLDQFRSLKFVFIGKQKKLNSGQMMMDIVYEKASEFKDRVLYLDNMEKEKLYPIIENSKAVVMPSKADNFPNACIEAMALRKIVIGSSCCGIEQLITDQVSGYLVEAGDHKGLLEAIIKVIGLSAEKRVQIEQKAYERIQDLEPEKIGLQLIDFYKSVIRRKTKNR